MYNSSPRDPQLSDSFPCITALTFLHVLLATKDGFGPMMST